MSETPETLAEVAYDAYCTAVGGKAFNGDSLPPFTGTPERIQRAWIVAVTAVVERIEEAR